MKNTKINQHIIKYILGLFTVLFIRLVPRIPNVEPIMSTMMPFSKKWGWLSGMLFCLLAILGYDIITGTIGVWSLMTAGTYALLGAAAGIYFKKRQSNIKNYLIFAIIGTIVFDAITGIGTGMLFFNQSFYTTFVGQIPFTMYHLAGNIFFAIVISPNLYKYVLENPQLETQSVINKVGNYLKNTN